MSLKLLCDENLPGAVVTFLSEQGHKVKRPLAGASDSTVAALAKKEKRVLVSLDSDFANILNYPPTDFSGIVRLNVHPPTVSLILRALTLVIRSFKKQEAFKGKLIIAEPAGFRVWGKKK
ncbi:MAG: DUF5615 family PIN-like protein [Patescibacteria group bacterium]